MVTKWVLEKSEKIRRRMDKTGEELSELNQVLHRINLQGIEGVDPSTGKKLIDMLHDETADVLAQLEMNEKWLKLDMCRINIRKKRKIEQMIEWEKLYFEDEKASI